MATRTKSKRKAKSSSGLTVKTFKGLNKKRMKSKGGGGNHVRYKQGDTVTLQFLTDPDGFREFEQHVWQEGKSWNYVPCAGDDCPLCDHEDEDVAKTGYRFSANVYNHKEKRVQVLDGPKDLAGRVFSKYERKPAQFRKRVYDISKLPTTPVSYDVEIAEVSPTNPRRLELIDLDEDLQEQLKRYYGDDLDNIGPTSTALDDEDDFPEEEDDDDFDEDDDWDEDEDEDEEDLEDLSIRELLAVAKEDGVPKKYITKAKQAKSKDMLIRYIEKARSR